MDLWWQRSLMSKLISQLINIRLETLKKGKIFSISKLRNYVRSAHRFGIISERRQRWWVTENCCFAIFNSLPRAEVIYVKFHSRKIFFVILLLNDCRCKNVGAEICSDEAGNGNLRRILHFLLFSLRSSRVTCGTRKNSSCV